jgi:hypothetical protein
MTGIIIGQVGLGRAQGDEKQYKYHLLATSRTSTMHKELNEVGMEGYILKGRPLQKPCSGDLGWYRY